MSYDPGYNSAKHHAPRDTTVSGHADTIRDDVRLARLRLAEGTVERYPNAQVSVRILDAEALLAENQRLRDALEQIASYRSLTRSLDAKAVAREALAGDTE